MNNSIDENVADHLRTAKWSFDFLFLGGYFRSPDDMPMGDVLRIQFATARVRAENSLHDLHVV